MSDAEPPERGEHREHDRARAARRHERDTAALAARRAGVVVRLAPVTDDAIGFAGLAVGRSGHVGPEMVAIPNAVDPNDRLVQLLSEARRILVFTGAGISTGSGIPDFRGPNGVWKKRQPVYFDEFLASEDKRVEHWDFKLESWRIFKDARPNPTHEAVAALERRGTVEAVVTQNIDGLHQAAGSKDVVELHGTNR